ATIEVAEIDATGCGRGLGGRIAGLGKSHGRDICLRNDHRPTAAAGKKYNHARGGTCTRTSGAGTACTGAAGPATKAHGGPATATARGRYGYARATAAAARQDEQQRRGNAGINELFPHKREPLIYVKHTHLRTH